MAAIHAHARGACDRASSNRAGGHLESAYARLQGQDLGQQSVRIRVSFSVSYSLHCYLIRRSGGMRGFTKLLCTSKQFVSALQKNLRTTPEFQDCKLASYWRGVYLQLQDDFRLQPFWVYRPLLALLLEPGRGVGGVDSSEPLAPLQLNRHPHEPRP